VNCPDVERVIDAYTDEELGEAEAADVRAHLAGCPACRQRVAARASLGRLIRRVPYYSATGSPAGRGRYHAAAGPRVAADSRLGRNGDAGRFARRRRGTPPRPVAAGKRRDRDDGAGCRRRSRAGVDGRAPLRRPLHRPAHGQALVPGQAGLLAAGRRPRAAGLPARRQDASTICPDARWPRLSISAASTRSTSSCGLRPTAMRRRPTRARSAASRSAIGRAPGWPTGPSPISTAWNWTNSSRLGGAMRALLVLTVCLVAFASSGHLSAAAELKVGDAAPDFMLQASNGKTYKGLGFQKQAGRRAGLVPKAYTRGCTIECKSLAEHGEHDQTVRRRLLHDQRRSARREHRVCGAAARRLPAPQRSHQEDCRRLRGPRRHGHGESLTFYIGKDGTIQSIDKNVKPATSAEDMAANAPRARRPDARPVSMITHRAASHTIRSPP